MVETLKSSSSFSIVIPVYNELNAIQKTLERVKTVLNRYPQNAYEIICIDDGSNDGTSELLTKIQGIQLCKHGINRGYGAALKTGLEKTSKEWIIILDADGTYPLEDIPKLLDETEKGFDMVVGARTGDGITMSPFKRIARWILRKMVHALTGVLVPDLNSGMRVFKKKLYEEFKHLLPMGFSFTTTLTVASLYSGRQTQFIPINYFVRIGKSNIKPIKNFLGFTMLIVRLASYFEPLRFFIPLSAFVGVVGLIKGGFDLYNLNHMGNLSVIIMLSALQILITGILCDVMVRRSSKS